MMTSLYHNSNPAAAPRSNSPPITHQVLAINNVNAATFFENA